MPEKRPARDFLHVLFSPAPVPRYFELFQNRMAPARGHIVHHVDPRRVLDAVEVTAR